MQTKRSENLDALTSNNQNEKHEAAVSPCLDKLLLFKVGKLREGELNKR